MRGEHAVKIEHHEQAAQRKWTFLCSCGFSGACHSEAEAKKLAEGHLELAELNIPRTKGNWEP